MAVLDFQGWDWAATATGHYLAFDRQELWVRSDPNLDYNKTGGPFGGPEWNQENANDFMDLNGSFGLSTIYFACYLHIQQAAWGESMFIFGEGTAGSGTNHVSFRPAGGKNCYVYRGDLTTELTTARFDIRKCTHRWGHLAIKLVIHDTTGSVTVEVNGEQVVNATGLDTRNGGTSGIIDFMRSEGQWPHNYRIAQPVFWSGAGDAPTDFFGLHRIHTLRPDADTSVQFTPQGAGSSYVEVDEDEYDDDTTYNESSTVTNKDKLGCTALPSGVNTIYAVQAKAMATDPDGTATENIQVGVDSGTESLGSSKALGLDYDLWEGAVETVDPNTAAAWTETNVNATDLVYVHA